MVLHPPVSLGKLCALVDEVAEEEEVVLRLDGECVAHEGCGIDGKGASHLTRNPERVMLAYAHLFIQYIRSNRSGMVVEALQEELTVQGSFAYPSQRQLGYRNSKLDPRNLMTSVSDILTDLTSIYVSPRGTNLTCRIRNCARSSSTRSIR